MRTSAVVRAEIGEKSARCVNPKDTVINNPMAIDVADRHEPPFLVKYLESPVDFGRYGKHLGRHLQPGPYFRARARPAR